MSVARRYAIASVLAAVTFLAASPTQGAMRADPPTWSEEFNGTSLDLSRWSHRATGVRHDGNLTPAAVSVGGGVLTIKAYTEAGKHYSGMISTQKVGAGGFEQAYGYFEARVKFNSAPGEWSAFWLQSPTIGNPIGDPGTAGVEMDIAEHRMRCVNAPPPAPPAACSATSDITNRIQSGLIWDGYGPESKALVKLNDPLPGLRNGSWHTWALRWTPTELTFYYDDSVIWTPPGTVSRKAQFIVLSTEIGQFFAGAIPPSGYGTRATTLTGMQVDYVRAWANPTAPAPGPGAPAPTADTTPPNAVLLGRRSQKLRTTVPVTVSCPDEACFAAAAGTVRVPRVGRARARSFKLKAKTAAIAMGAQVRVRPTLSPRARSAIRRALRARKRVVVTLDVRVADSAGNVRPLTRRIALKL